jgi:hypothetical protein
MKHLLVVLLAFAIGSVCFGDPIPDTPENRQKQAERYLLVMPSKALIEDITLNMAATKGENSERDKVIHALVANVDFEAVNRAIMKSLMKVFTAEEIKAMADFYGSPAGKAAMNKSGVYMTDLRPALMAELIKAQTKAGLSKQNP